MRNALRGHPCSRAAMCLGFALLVTGVTPSSPQESPQSTRQPATLLNHIASAPMLDVARCGNNIIAVGNRGVILVSSDSGQRWAQRLSPTDVTLTSLVCVDDTHAYAVGHEETLLRTDDAGLTWKLVQTDSNGAPLLRVRFFGHDTGFAVGGLGTLLKTVDGGATWARSTITTSDGFDPHLFDLTAVTDGRLIIAAEAGRLLRSSDGGSNWTELTTPYTGSFFGLAPLGEDQLIAYGMLGHAFISRDGGDSWIDVSIEKGPSLFSSVATNSHVFLCGADGVIATATVADPRKFSTSAVPGRPNINGMIETSAGLVIASDRGMAHVSPPPK